MAQGGRRIATGVAAAFVLACAGWVGSAGASTAAKSLPAPKGLPKFYSVPQPLPKKAGTLVKSEKIDAPQIEGDVYRVMYVSKSLQDEPIAVTGLIAVPKGDAPAGGRPVLTWAHGTNGMADECAPSLESVPGFANPLLAQGWLLTATDYQGEGTPGLHPYIAGTNSARDTLDIVRAARQLKGADASKDYVVWGHSQGGHTAMFALHEGDDYAPELNLKGVVAGAPPSQFQYIYDFLKTSTFKHYLLMAAGGLNAAYGDKAAPLGKVLTKEGQDLLPLLDQGCSDYVADHTKDVSFEEVTKGNPFEIPEWRKLLAANDPQEFLEPSPEPLLIIQGGNDEQIPVVSTQLLADHLCDIGQDLQRWIYPGQTHSGVIAPSLNDMIEWIKHRFADEPTPDAYAPVGQADVQITRCPA